MVKLAIICVTSLLIFATDLRKNKLSRLHSVETYEIQPGILVMPTYSHAGDLCTIVIQKQHVSSEGVDLDAEMSRQEIYGVFDRLAPKGERGRPKLSLGEGSELTLIDGPTLVTNATYENVSLQMYGKNRNDAEIGYVAAVIRWKKGECRQD